jgi:hypothetical protein
MSPEAAGDCLENTMDTKTQHQSHMAIIGAVLIIAAIAKNIWQTLPMLRQT